jgi:indolepyruvate ferredoxin oxidoreductase
MKDSIARYTNAAPNVSVEARRLAEGLFGDYMATNMFALGVAYQSGLLPISARSIEAAILLNNVQVNQNLQTFRYGRLYVADPHRVRELVEPPRPTFEGERARVLSRLSGKDAHAYISLLERCGHLDEESRRLLAIRVGELIDYQNARYPESYVDFVAKVASLEQATMPGAVEIAHAVTRYLYKLMTYKDEYEVARLHLKSAFHAETRGLFVEPRRLVYNFHPPLLRALGVKRKLQFGPWFTPVLRALRGLRRLRGTPLDIFGYARVRREERRLIQWYKALVELALDHLSSDRYPVVLEITQLPDRIRGYEEIKLDNVEAVKAQTEKLMERLTAKAQGAPQS